MLLMLKWLLYCLPHTVQRWDVERYYLPDPSKDNTM